MLFQFIQSVPHELQRHPAGQSFPQGLHLQPLRQLEHTIDKIIALRHHALYQLSIALLHHEF
jgi:hypothetical protein